MSSDEAFPHEMVRVTIFRKSVSEMPVTLYLRHRMRTNAVFQARAVDGSCLRFLERIAFGELEGVV